jgi:CDP-diacylglycerol--serine O-phosphatidyltransferase
MWAIVLATRGEYYRAGWFIVFAGILDTLDGRVARLSGTGTRFGAELDSLVDIVSFGVAPAFLMYQIEFSRGGAAAWIFCYFYGMAAAIRLARFNVTQAGRAKAYFIGLPSPAAGMTLATFYPFTQTEWFAALGGLPWQLLLTFLMIALTMLMVSNVHYPTLPRAGFRTARGLLGLTLIVVILVFGIWKHDVFLFPLGILYVAYGVVRAVLLGFFAAPAEDEEAEIAGPIVIDESEQSFRPRSGGSASGGASGAGASPP